MASRLEPHPFRRPGWLTAIEGLLDDQVGSFTTTIRNERVAAFESTGRTRAMLLPRPRSGSRSAHPPHARARSRTTERENVKSRRPRSALFAPVGLESPPLFEERLQHLSHALQDLRCWQGPIPRHDVRSAKDRGACAVTLSDKGEIRNGRGCRGRMIARICQPGTGGVTTSARRLQEATRLHTVHRAQPTHRVVPPETTLSSCDRHHLQ